MHPTKFQVNWPFDSGEEGKIDFQDGSHGGHLGLQIRKILGIFFIYKSPQCFLPSFKSIGLSVQEMQKLQFQDGSDLGFLIVMILVIFFYLQVTLMLPV